MSADPTDDDDDLIAAEYALGLQTGEERAAARERVTRDAAFAQAVTAWEIRLTGLTDPLEDVVPDPSIKRVLLSRLFSEPAQRSPWQRLWFWQAISALSLLVLAALFFTEFSAPGDQRGPLYTAEIVADAGDFRAIAVVDKSTNEVILTRTRGQAPPGRILQVWAHGEGAPAISVGLWPEGESTRLPMPPTIAAVEGVLTLGVSEEPPGGSKTGSPSGRIFGTVDIPGVSAGF